ncbi:PP2C family protein-serine/threonine phosphatase [Candidatus Latescibacterota bacterium]
MFDFKVSGITDVGRIRDHNEDAFLIDNPLFIVADGMGGAAAGEIASSIAIKTISEDLKNFSYANDSEAVNLLKKAIRKADEEIKVQMEQDSSLNGMGTTLVLGFRIDSRLLLGNVGDSRAYVISKPDSGKVSNTGTNLISNAAAETGVMPKFDMDKKEEKNSESIRRLTQDHSVVMEMVNSGVIEEKDIRTHPMRNRITRCLGSIGSSEPDFVWHDISHGDTLLLCSDGLWEMVHEDLILAIINSSADLEDACKRLITAANNSGGADNITAITVKFENS